YASWCTLTKTPGRIRSKPLRNTTRRNVANRKVASLITRNAATAKRARPRTARLRAWAGSCENRTDTSDSAWLTTTSIRSAQPLPRREHTWISGVFEIGRRCAVQFVFRSEASRHKPKRRKRHEKKRGKR